MLLHDEGGTGRSEARHLFLFSTCLLMCVKSEKAGKWQLKVLMRMASGVSFDVKGGLLFAVTKAGGDRSRTFLFGCLEQHECAKWKTAFTSALDAATRGDDLVPSADTDAKVGSLLLGLKGALGGDDDRQHTQQPPQQLSNKSAAAATAAAAAAKPAPAQPADDDDPFAAIARRPSKSAAPPTAAPAVAAPSASTAFDLFGAPASAAPAAPAKAALSGDALMALYAQSSAPAAVSAAPVLAPTGPNYGAPLFGAPFAQAQQPQQPHLFAAAPVAHAQQQPQQQPPKHDPFASLL